MRPVAEREPIALGDGVQPIVDGLLRKTELLLDVCR